MTDRIKWDIEHLKKDNRLQNEEIDELKQQVRNLESFRDTTMEKLITIFNIIEELKEGDKWIKRTFTTALITVSFGAIVSLLAWFIQL